MLGLRLDRATDEKLARVARREGRTKSDVARSALRDYLSRAEDDAALIAEVKRIAALTPEEDLAYLDELQDDLEQLLADEERSVSARRAA